MHPNSNAYRDAWLRIRNAIAEEAATRDIILTDECLDDMACEAAHAAFGLSDDEPDNAVVETP